MISSPCLFTVLEARRNCTWFIHSKTHMVHPVFHCRCSFFHVKQKTRNPSSDPDYFCCGVYSLGGSGCQLRLFFGLFLYLGDLQSLSGGRRNLHPQDDVPNLRLSQRRHVHTVRCNTELTSNRVKNELKENTCLLHFYRMLSSLEQRLLFSFRLKLRALPHDASA